MVTVARPLWKIEIKTGDKPPYPEWLELRGYGQRFKYVEKADAERVLAKLQAVQPHGEFRIVPI
jgi:hypothetical protein